MDSGGNNDRNCVLYGTFNTYSVLFNVLISNTYSVKYLSLQ